MKTGYKFKGKHSSEFGITMKTASRPIHPEVKSYKYETPLMDGSYDFSASNPYGREFYQNRIFTLSLQIHAENIFELQKKISSISIWHRGSGELIFDDMPAVIWEATVLNSIDYAPERSGHKAILTVSFEVKPFSKAMFSTLNGPEIGYGIAIDSAVPLDMPMHMTFNTNTFTVKNIGSWYIRPVITLSSESYTFDIMTLSCGEKKISLKNIGSGINTIVLDMKRQTVTDGSGKSLMKYFSGEFFEIPPGECEITAAANFTGFKVTVDYIPEFMYDFYADWSEDDA